MPTMKSETTHPVTEIITEILNGICIKTNALKVDESFVDKNLRIEASCHPDDYRIVVGRGGARIKAIQFIAMLAGQEFKIKCEFNLCASVQRPSPNKDVFTAAKNFDSEPLAAFVKRVCEAIGITDEINTADDPFRSATIFHIKSRNSDQELAVHCLHEIFFSHGYKIGRRIEIKNAK